MNRLALVLKNLDPRQQLATSKRACKHLLESGGAQPGDGSHTDTLPRVLASVACGLQPGPVRLTQWGWYQPCCIQRGR